MTTHALNTGALNKVPFPLTEQGTSIIELLGTVEVTASISVIRLRLTAAATTAPSAVCSVNTTKLKINVLAQTPAEAVVQDITYRTKIQVKPTGSAIASTRAGYTVKHNVSALVAPTSAYSVTSYQITKKGASTTASGYGSMRSLKSRFNSAAISAQAVVKDITPLYKVRFSATQAATATTLADLAFARRVAGSTAATAVGTVFPLRYMPFSATAAPSQITTLAKAILRLATLPGNQSSAAITKATARLKAVTGATVQTKAVAQDIVFIFKLTAGATTVAKAIDTAVGLDFASKMPAPLERQIVVPPYDRTMKVVA